MENKDCSAVVVQLPWICKVTVDGALVLVSCLGTFKVKGIRRISNRNFRALRNPMHSGWLGQCEFHGNGEGNVHCEGGRLGLPTSRGRRAGSMQGLWMPQGNDIGASKIVSAVLVLGRGFSNCRKP